MDYGLWIMVVHVDSFGVAYMQIAPGRIQQGKGTGLGTRTHIQATRTQSFPVFV